MSQPTIIAHGKSSRRFGWNVFAAYEYVRWLRSWKANAYLRFGLRGVYVLLCKEPLSLWQIYTAPHADGSLIGPFYYVDIETGHIIPHIRPRLEFYGDART